METGIILAVLGINALWDIRKKEILPVVLIGSVLAGIVVRLLTGYPAGGGIAAMGRCLVGIGCGLAPGAAMLLFSRVSGGKLGGGDAAALWVPGVWAGAGAAVGSFLLGLFLASVAVGIGQAAGHRQKEVPFIPFLLAGFFLWHLVRERW